MLMKAVVGAGLGSLLLLSTTACEAPTPGSPQRSGQAIVNGESAADMDNVVALVAGTGWNIGMCSGTLIAERVVLTAKHCVQDVGAAGPRPASEMKVRIGARAMSGFDEYRVVDVVTTPGSYRDGAFLFTDLGGKDVALVTLQTAPGITPMPVKLASPTGELHSTALAVGYGETPSGNTGVKMRVNTTIDAVQQTMIRVEGTTCQGDSGGPLIADDGEVIGVTSMGSSQYCGAGGPSYFNRVDIYADMILETIERSGSCLEDGAEVCDGFDNDCDDQVDEDCKDNGEACEIDGHCSSGVCAQTSLGKLCTTECDPSQAAGACGQGFVCAADSTSCNGFCVPGDFGEKQAGTACEENSECASLLCKDPGDGDKRCLDVCRGGAGQCLAGDACVAQDGACGACVDADLIESDLGQDEPCDSDDRCRSGRCLDDGGIKYCADSCERDSECGQNHHCRAGACVRGDRGSYGDACVEHDDCVKDFVCLATDAGRFCTITCEDECGEGFTCTQVNNGKVCLPDESVVGGPCSADDECLSGLCIEDEGVCTRNCRTSADCGPGLDCVRSDAGSPGVCVGAGVEPSDGDGDEGGDGDGDGDSAEDGDTDELEEEVNAIKKSDDDGCSLSPATASSVPTFLAIGVLVLSLRMWRRRRAL
jgi:V8-like Glu-specific endopeptidase